MTNKKDIYWNLNKTLTYNYLINVIVGNRGGGKSYGAKKWGIDNFLKRGEQFGYIRRYKDEGDEPVVQFFEDIKDKYPDYEFKTTKKYLYMRLKPENEKQKWTDQDICGYVLILSTASNKKSISYPNVTTLIFDEFILEEGSTRYLPNEPTKLLNLYETIARPGTDHARVRLFMLANAITITNPYFLYWDLKMPKKQDKNEKWIWLHPTKPILVEDVKVEEFIAKKKETEFGKLVEGTKFGDFTINNKFLLDDNTFIEKKSGSARYFFTFKYKAYTFGVWCDFNQGKLWVSNDVDPSFLLTYSLTLKDHSPNTLLINTRGKKGHFKTFTDAFKNGCLYFENQNIKNLTYEVIKMVLN